ncbi:MAG: hypothetical protein ACREDM_13585 [Methylocella sp.]
MQQFSFTHNIYADGDLYLKGFLGFSLLPSSEARRNKSNYETDIVYMLGKLYAKFVSSRVLMAIGQHQNRTVTIRLRPIPDPNPEVAEVERLYNATTEPSDSADTFRQGDQFTPYVPGKEPWQVAPIVGTGKGSDVEISFNPGVYADAMGQAPLNLLGQSDYVLLHELVHAMSDVSATRASGMGGPAGYDNLEEFTSIVVANVYISEVGGGYGRLVGGHGGERLPLLLTGSQAFYNRFSNYMEQVCANHPWLAKQLKQATGIAHNPFVHCSGV